MAALVPSVCKWCGQPIRYCSELADIDMAWKHAHGFYGCDLKAPYYSPTSAEPPVVISSPAYQLPEVKSRAQAFAEAYRELHDLPFSVVSHLEWAYLMGQQEERLKGGVR